MNTLRKAALTDIQSYRLHPVDIEEPLNAKLFKYCIASNCLPLTSGNIGDDTYYFVHHEEVVLYIHNPSSPMDGYKDVEEWLESHHEIIRTILQPNKATIDAVLDGPMRLVSKE